MRAEPHPSLSPGRRLRSTRRDSSGPALTLLQPHPVLNFRRGSEERERRVSLFSGISASVSGGRKGGAVNSAGTDTGVNLIERFLITNAQESPDVGQRDGRSKKTGVPVGWSGSKAPAASTADLRHLAATVSRCVTQESPAAACGSSVFHPLLWGSSAGGLPSEPPKRDAHLKGRLVSAENAHKAEPKSSALLISGLAQHLTRDAPTSGSSSGGQTPCTER